MPPILHLRFFRTQVPSTPKTIRVGFTHTNHLGIQEEGSFVLGHYDDTAWVSIHTLSGTSLQT